MAKKKLATTITLNALEFIIEYMLISSILKKIGEMTKKPLEYPRNNTKLDPLRHLLKIRTWGRKWKRVINKIVEWATWWWANLKMDKESLFIMKQSVNISKDNITKRKTPFSIVIYIWKHHFQLQFLFCNSKMTSTNFQNSWQCWVDLTT